MNVNSTSIRFWFLISSVLLLVTLIVIRLIDVQLVRGEWYAQQADDNRYFTVRTPAERGIFLDRFDVPMVVNKRTYAKRQDVDALHTTYQPISHDEALQLIATDSSQIQYGIERVYEYGQAAAHVLGYVGAVTSDDLLTNNSLMVSDYIGKTGLEKLFDEQLRGQAGKEVFEINALGQRQRLVEKIEGKPGQNITTAIDPFLSTIAWEALGNVRGSVVIMDAQTSEVLALVSRPGYDPNVFSTSSLDPVLEHQRRQQLQQVLTDEQKPFFNRAVAGVYPPGSVFKLVTALGGLETGAVDSSTTVLDEGVLKVGEYEYANWYYTQFGRTEGAISMERALARSNDIYFYKVAELLGPQSLAEYARLFGYGEITGIELSAEAKGTVPDPAWKERVIGEPWYLGNTFHMGIGQGDVLVTPLQVAQMTQGLANHGTLCRPSLLKQRTASDCREISLDETHLEVILSGMIDVCAAGGTAFPFFQYNEPYFAQKESAESMSALIHRGAVACKTGTAEFGGADERGYRKTHGWFTAIVGTAPIIDSAKQAGEKSTDETISDDSGTNEDTKSDVDTQTDQSAHSTWLQRVKNHGFPDKLVIVVLVESDDEVPFKEGSQHAAPVAKTIVDWMIAGEAVPTVDVTE